MSRPSSRQFRASFPDVSAADFRTAAWLTGLPGPEKELTLFHPTLGDSLLSAATLGGEVGVTLVPDSVKGKEEHRSYARLQREVVATARELVSKGLSRGERVLVILPTSFEFFITFFAIQRAGGIPVPSYPPATLERAEISIERISHIADRASVTWCITTGALRAVLGDVALRHKGLRHMLVADRLIADALAVDVALTDAGADVPDGDQGLPEIDSNDLAFLQYTSGSTGNPKGVQLTHRNVLSNLHVLGQGMHVSRRDVVVSWLPLYHDMGLIGGMLTPVYWRVPLVLMSPVAFLRRPSRWLSAISRHKGTMSPAPNFAYALAVKRVTQPEREGLDLSSWRVAFNGAEPVHSGVVRRFEETYAPYGFKRETMFPVYGLAEASLAVTFPRPGDPTLVERVDRKALANGNVVPSESDTAIELVCVGKALPAHRVMIVDELGTELADRQVGHVVVRGPSVTTGYYQDPAATAKVLRGGWLWTGDLGYFVDGSLFITGRVGDLIIVRGHNYYAEDVERIVEGVDGARPGSVVAFAIYDEDEVKDDVLVVCETALTSPDEQSALAARVMERVAETSGLTLKEVVLVEPGSIPKTSSGKRQRKLTRERYLAGTLAASRTGKLQLLKVFARSAVGVVAMLGRQVSDSVRPRSGS